jgi:hypothetical protein
MFYEEGLCMGEEFPEASIDPTGTLSQAGQQFKLR